MFGWIGHLAGKDILSFEIALDLAGLGWRIWLGLETLLDWRFG